MPGFRRKRKRTFDPEQLLKKYDWLLCSTANEYAIPGKVDEEDLFNTAALALIEVADDLDPATYPLDFKKLAQTVVGHRAVEQIRPFFREMRDVRKEVYGDKLLPDGTPMWQVLEAESVILNRNRYPNPVEVVIVKDEIVHIRRHLRSRFLALRCFGDMINSDSVLCWLHRQTLAEGEVDRVVVDGADRVSRKTVKETYEVTDWTAKVTLAQVKVAVARVVRRQDIWNLVSKTDLELARTKL